MQSTRARIFHLLKGGGATVDDITNELVLAPATVRRHLDVLLRDGLVEMRSERVPLGRPHFVFTLTVTGLETLPGRQMHLVAAVYQTILDLTPEDTHERSGRELGLIVFERLAEAVVRHLRPMVTATAPLMRLEQAIEALVAAGLAFELSCGDEGYLVRGGVCPCTRLLSDAPPCGHEEAMITTLAGVSLQPVNGANGERCYLSRTGMQGVL